MYWTFELASYLEQAPWPATKKELIDYCTNCAEKRVPFEVVENLQEQLPDDDTIYYGMEDIWADQPGYDEYYFDEDSEE